MAAHAFNEAVPQEVRRSVTDPARLCPVLPGAAWLEGDRLKVRTVAGEIEVHAPNELLVQLYTACDGTRTLEEVRALAPGLGDFVDDLLAKGALVDASLLTLGAASFAQQGSRFGRAAPKELTDGLSRRFMRAGTATESTPAGTRHVDSAPMSALFAARISSSEFGRASLSEDALLAFAWSIAGVVQMPHERNGRGGGRRTLASAGGMHLLQVYLVLGRPVENHGPAVYRVLYPAAKSVALQRLGGDAAALPAAFIQPGQVASATGAVFLCAEATIAAMRYRNRAVQFLFMEAGAALHNAALTAPQLGMGFATIGGYDEAAVERLCGLQDQLVLGAGIFGPAAAVTST